MAIQSLADKVTERFIRTGQMTRGLGWASVSTIARRKLDMLHYASELQDLRSPPGNREEFLVPLGMTQKELADHIGCDVKVINRIVNGRTSVTAEMALRLGAALRMSPEFWLNAQQAVEIYEAARNLKRLPAPLPLAG